MTVDGANSVPGLADVRPLVVEVVSTVTISAVTVNGLPCSSCPSCRAASEAGRPSTPGPSEHACPTQPSRSRTRSRSRSPVQAPTTASLLLVCDRAFTDWGEDVYARFIQPFHTTHGPITELKLDPSLTYPYMYPQPPDEQRNCPMWTFYLDDVFPDQEIRLVFEKRRGGTVVYSNPLQYFRSSGPGGYVGELRGSLY